MNLRKLDIKIVIYSFTTCLLLFLSTRLVNLHPKPIIKISKEESSTKLSPDLIKLSTVGQKRFISKMIWIRTLIDSDVEKVREDENSWMFFNFKSIHFLDPMFLFNYIFGALYLSVVKDDLNGASFMYDKASKIYPNHFHLNYYGGIHYLFEIGNKKKALSFLNRVKDHPKAPRYLKSIIARIYADKNDLKASYLLIQSSLKDTSLSPVLIEKFNKSLYAIKAEIDLKCLNNKNEKCEYLDQDGNPYIFKNGRYQAEKPWEPFRINTPKYYRNKK